MQLCTHLLPMHDNKQLGFGKACRTTRWRCCMTWVKKNSGVDPLHPDHSINCTAVAVLHLPALPPFPGHVSLIHAVQTIGARVDALQLRHADLFRRVYALPDMIQRTFVKCNSAHTGNQELIVNLHTHTQRQIMTSCLLHMPNCI